MICHRRWGFSGIFVTDDGGSSANYKPKEQLMHYRKNKNENNIKQ